MSNHISILLVGKSGAGKSEFINSFAEHRNQIEASGEGQTTRTIVEYHFSINELSPKVTVEYLTEEEFLEKRLAKEIEIPKHKYSHSIKEQILETKGFFNYTEFDFEDNNNSKKIEELWEGILHTLNLKEENLEEIYTQEQIENVVSYLKSQFVEDLTFKIPNKKSYNLNDILEVYLKAVYRICKKAVESFPREFNLNTLTQETTEQLKFFLKIDQKKSATGLLKKVVIKDNISSQFKAILKQLQVQTITFIDTYGLDHSEQPDVDALKSRYQMLFNEYAELDSVFFIRALNTDSPSDLSTAIPAIYDANPSAVPYLVCTKIDENTAINTLSNKNIIDLLDLNETHQFKAISHLIDSTNEKDLKRILFNARIPETLIESRYDVLISNIVSYCSKDNVNYNENNLYQISKVFKSIVNKEHLGSAIIDTTKLHTQILQAESQINNLMRAMFKNASKDWNKFKRSARTLWKNKEYLESGILGYNGTYYDSWQNRFLSGYAQSFSKLSDNEVKSLFDVTPGSNEARALLEIINNFSSHLVKFNYSYELSTGNNLTEFMQELVMKNPMFSSGKFEYNKNIQVNEWLTQVYDFEGYFNRVEANMHTLFIKEFEQSFLKECERHNRRVAMRSL